MWYKNNYRRHLCDMHIDDWDDAFLSEFSPDEYVENLKKAKIQNAMLYFQSHVGLCNYPTKSGKMHNAFRGREDTMRKVADMCHNENIAVTGYYSLIYNNWAHDNHPEWRMIDETGRSVYEQGKVLKAEFANNDIFRYGLCCPNNQDYREFVRKQIKEMAEYFTVDGMFYDMLFWPHMCYCDSCKKRWTEEVGGDIPTVENWKDEAWLLHIEKRRQWMGEFAQMVTDYTKELIEGVSVEHNFACAVLSDGKLAIAEPVNNACDYVGGDLYGGIYRQSFTCKFYRNITKNNPFEYMFSRVEGNLSKHTLTKSKDVMLSQVYLTAAHHGATLVIDAIDPIGTMDRRVYEKVGEIFDEVISYEKYYKGEMLEDVGIYYSLKSKFNAHGEEYTNHLSAVNTLDTMIFNNVPAGVTGGWHKADINKYKLLIASNLTQEDSYDFERLVNYVKNGGKLYISGGDCTGLLEKFFGAQTIGRTVEKVTYIAPQKEFEGVMGDFNDKYPLHFDGTAPIVAGIDADKVLATITLPYTNQNTIKFVSIHSNPPGIPTDIPAMAMTEYGKGKVFWSAQPIEQINLYSYRNAFMGILEKMLRFDATIKSDAPKDIEIVTFVDGNDMYVSTVGLNEDYKARKFEDFKISIKSDKKPESIKILPLEESVEFNYSNGEFYFKSENLKIFNMYKIEF